MGELFGQTHGKIERLLDKVINQSKVLPLFWRGEINEESDPSTISWADAEDALREFCLFTKNELYPVLGPLFKVGKYAAYKEASILDVLMYMVVHCVASKNGAKGFRREYGKGPSDRTIRRRLGNLEFSEVESALLKANKRILSYFRKKRKYNRILSLFKKRKKPRLVVLISVDITYEPCYGKRRKYACGMKRKKGTNWGYKYASIIVSIAGVNITLYTMPLTQFTTNPKMLEKLIKEARKYVEIKTLLVDREFSNSPCIQKLEELNVKYLTPVVEHQTEFLQSLRPPCKARMPLGSIEVSIIAVRDPSDPEEVLYYVTNLKINLESLEKVIKIYRKRWIIENAFKSQKLDFLAKTYSVNPTIRYFLWTLATLLYNAWVLCNFCASTDAGVKLCKRKRPVVTAFEFGIEMKITFLSSLFSKDDPEEILCVAIALVKQYLLKNLPQEEIIPQYMMNT